MLCGLARNLGNVKVKRAGKLHRAPNMIVCECLPERHARQTRRQSLFSGSYDTSLATF